ncbi:Uncharacterised protein [Mycobacteroides abscessus subsp. abscessus]|nr:Uncharacterised protein [Mycobacteroides abscessus subsp. abscessus]
MQRWASQHDHLLRVQQRKRQRMYRIIGLWRSRFGHGGQHRKIWVGGRAVVTSGV